LPSSLDIVRLQIPWPDARIVATIPRGIPSNRPCYLVVVVVGGGVATSTPIDSKESQTPMVDGSGGVGGMAVAVPHDVSSSLTRRRRRYTRGPHRNVPVGDGVEIVSRASWEDPRVGDVDATVVVVPVEHHSSSSQLTRRRKSREGGYCIDVGAGPHTLHLQTYRVRKEGLGHDHTGSGDSDLGAVVVLVVVVVVVDVVVAMDCDPSPLVSTSTIRARSSSTWWDSYPS
jgi:hypothetical protein